MEERIFPTEEIDVQKMAGRAGLLHNRELHMPGPEGKKGCSSILYGCSDEAGPST